MYEAAELVIRRIVCEHEQLSVTALRHTALDAPQYCFSRREYLAGVRKLDTESPAIVE